VVVSEGDDAAMGDGMVDDANGKRRRPAPSPPGGGDAVYGLGLIGALVWTWQQADGLGEHLVGILKSFVWPAFLVYDAMKSLGT
jgi:hypothetical protein